MHNPSSYYDAKWGELVSSLITAIIADYSLANWCDHWSIGFAVRPLTKSPTCICHWGILPELMTLNSISCLFHFHHLCSLWWFYIILGECKCPRSRWCVYWILIRSTKRPWKFLNLKRVTRQLSHFVYSYGKTLLCTIVHPSWVLSIS